ncbi:MAG TPA: hypothetical protein VFQ61_22910 [Polyangiaceae bacterium]|nr:hypothetical protein [Polyangiaceae bacterium]
MAAVVEPGSPREDPEGAEVGHEERVSLLGTGEALERGAVEDGAAGKGPLEVHGRDLDRLVDAEQIGELQEERADAPSAELVKDLLFRHLAQRQGL